MPRISTLSIALLVGTLLSTGQDVFRSDTSLVNILATVHDDKGRVVRGLTRDDFLLREDGRPEEIHDFAAQSELALTLALLVDTSRSMNMVLDYEQQASIAFLKNALRPGQDRAAVFHFDSEVEMLSAVEGPGKQLADAVHRIQPTRDTGPIPTVPGPSTALYDAIISASNQLRPIPGRKAMIVLTDGVDVGSRQSLDDAVESALRSDAAVYTILVSPARLVRSSRYHPAPTILSRNQAVIQRYHEMNLAKGRAALTQISAQTGGHEFEATLAHSVKSLYAAITDELRNQYRIGLVCRAQNCQPGYHSLLLKTRTNRQTVDSRRGFFIAARD